MTLDLSTYTAARRVAILAALNANRDLDVTDSWPLGHHLRGSHVINVDVTRSASRGDPQDSALITAVIDKAVRS